MDIDESLKGFKCPHRGCSEYNKENSGNIQSFTRYSRKNIRLLRCTKCEKTFSELAGTPFHGSRLDWVDIGKIFVALMDNEDLRSIARSQQRSRNTIKRYLKLAKADCKGFFADLVAYKVLDLSQKKAFEAAVKKDYSLTGADQAKPRTRLVGYSRLEPAVVEEYA